MHFPLRSKTGPRFPVSLLSQTLTSDLGVTRSSRRPRSVLPFPPARAPLCAAQVQRGDDPASAKPGPLPAPLPVRSCSAAEPVLRSPSALPALARSLRSLRTLRSRSPVSGLCSLHCLVSVACPPSLPPSLPLPHLRPSRPASSGPPEPRSAASQTPLAAAARPRPGPELARLWNAWNGR